MHQDYNKVAHAEVTSAYPTDRGHAVDFANDKVGQPFDYVSCMDTNTKQIDESEGPHGDEYYCSELVWAAYKQEQVDIDIENTPDDERVTNQEIADHPDVEIYKTYEAS